MRPLAILIVFLATVGCAGADSEPTPSPQTPRSVAGASIDDCLVNGRSMEFDAQVRGWFALLVAKEAERTGTDAQYVPKFNPRPGGLRIGPADGSLYTYTTEFTFVRVGDGWEYVTLASGTVDAVTCEAVLESPPPP